MTFTALQKHLQSSKDGRLPGRIRVVEENDFFRISGNQIELTLGERRSQRGNSIDDPRLMHGNYIHVAFDDNHFFLFTRLCKIESVQVSLLGIYDCFRRINIFGISVTQDSSPESYDFSQDIKDRKHQASAEKIQKFAFFASRKKAALRKNIVRISLRLKMPVQSAPVIRRISQAESFGCCSGYLTVRQVLPCRLPAGRHQVLIEITGSLYQ